MPAATTALGLTFTNLGPLTTTFTPAPSCTDLAKQSGVGQIFQNAEQGSNNGSPYGSVGCSAQDIASCVPNGDVRQSINDHEYYYTIAYNSPGLQCPSGWEAKSSDVPPSAHAAASTSGADKNIHKVVRPLAVAFLDPGESVTFCCPSGYGLQREFMYGCTSNIGPASSYGYTEICSNDQPTTTIAYTVDGERLYNIAPVQGATTKYTHLPLSTGDGNGYSVYHTMPPVLLINGGTASPTAGSVTSATDDSKTSSTSASKKGDDKNLAAGQTPSLLAVTVVGSLVAAFAGSLL